MKLRITKARWYHKIIDIFNPKKLVGGSTVIIPVTISAKGEIYGFMEVPDELIQRNNLNIVRETTQNTLINEFHKTETQKVQEGIREQSGFRNDLIRPIAVTGHKGDIIYLEDPYSRKKFYVDIKSHKEALGEKCEA